MDRPKAINANGFVYRDQTADCDSKLRLLMWICLVVTALAGIGCWIWA